MATPAVIRRMLAAGGPAGPRVASRWPGRGLWAGDLALVRPSGYKIVFWIRAAGAVMEAGASAAARPRVVATAMAANRAAARAPPRAAIMAASTASAGQAVYFIAQATPRTTAASRAGRASAAARVRAAAARVLAAGRAGRVSRARARQVRASTGGSVMPRAIGNAITGEAVAKAARRSGAGWAAARNAAASSRKVAAASQGRGSPASPGRPSALGSPKIAMTGR